MSEQPVAYKAAYKAKTEVEAWSAVLAAISMSELHHTAYKKLKFDMLTIPLQHFVDLTEGKRQAAYNAYVLDLVYKRIEWHELIDGAVSFIHGDYKDTLIAICAELAATHRHPDTQAKERLMYLADKLGIDEDFVIQAHQFAIVKVKRDVWSE